MPIDTSSAAAIVRFAGLGVLSMAEGNRQAKNLFLHEAGHTLTVEIFKPLVERMKAFYSTYPWEAEGLAAFKRFPDDAESCALYKRLAVYEDLDVSQMDTQNGSLDISIDVSAAEGAEFEGVQTFKHPTPSIDRMAPDDYKNDIRWMVSSYMLGRRSAMAMAALTCPTTELRIRNATLYTETLAADENKNALVFKKVRDIAGAAPEWAAAETFGSISDEIGAVIDAKIVKVEVTIGTEVHTHMLPKLELPYVIYIKNNAAVSGSDMPIYRRLYDPVGDTFDLLTAAEIDSQQGSTMITGRDFCSGIADPPID
jgi:hypothetical protein